MLIRMRKSQSTLEYALLVGVVVASLLFMQNYLKRSMQGRLQTVSDQVGDQYSPGNTYRKDAMKVTNDQIVETTVPGVGSGVVDVGTAATTTTEVSGGSQAQDSERKVQDLDKEEWKTENQAK